MIFINEFVAGRGVKMKKMIEIRWHGRGGQGAWTASELLARTAIYEGKHIQSFPEFGPERMGAPVAAFTRISLEVIRLHCAVYDPDVVVVLDNTLLNSVNVTSGVNKPEDIIIINSPEKPETLRKELRLETGKIWTVPATEIVLKILGSPITNTAMLGAVARATGLITLEALEKTVKQRFNEDLAEKNFAVIKKAYEEAIPEETNKA
jgi:2-oxoacid:acceptor oxidoreductase gamma subunit (pyruvate/2-ketoisovalerate family)